MPRYKIEDFERVIPGSGGIITTIAVKLGCEWHTAKKRIDASAKLRQMVDDESKKIDDMAESVVINAIKEKDIQTAKWWLERRKRDIFATRQEMAGVANAPIVINIRESND